MTTIALLSAFVAIVALIVFFIAKNTADELRGEIGSLKRQFEEQVGKLLHETPDERQARESKEVEKRREAEKEEKSLSDVWTSESPSGSDSGSDPDEEWCYEKGASPGGGCVGK